MMKINIILMVILLLLLLAKCNVINNVYLGLQYTYSLLDVTLLSHFDDSSNVSKNAQWKNNLHNTFSVRPLWLAVAFTW